MWSCIPKYWFTLFCRKKFLSRIHALCGVPFTGLKNMVAYQKWQIWGMSMWFFWSTELVFNQNEYNIGEFQFTWISAPAAGRLFGRKTTPFTPLEFKCSFAMTARSRWQWWWRTWSPPPWKQSGSPSAFPILSVEQIWPFFRWFWGQQCAGRWIHHIIALWIN